MCKLFELFFIIWIVIMLNSLNALVCSWQIVLFLGKNLV